MFRHTISCYEEIRDRWFRQMISERSIETLFNWFLFFSNMRNFSNFMKSSEWRKLCKWFISVLYKRLKRKRNFMHIHIKFSSFYVILSNNVIQKWFHHYSKNAQRQQRVDNICKFLKFIIIITHNWTKEFYRCKFDPLNV